MDGNLLRSWVGLPPGPWPPGDRELLGLPADGPLDTAAVEAAALGRMAGLRTHQLLHPDLVTEGMNRVAQAMMTATTATAPRRQKPPPPAPLPPVPVAPAAKPKVPDAVPVVPEPPVAAVAPVPAFQRPAVELIRIPDDVPPPPGLARHLAAVPPHARRATYRELAGLRALRRALDTLKPSVALPGEGLRSPAAVCDLLDAITEFRHAAGHRGLGQGFARTLAPGLSAVLSHSLPLAVFRSLTRPQRLNLAREWASGRAGLVARLDALRADLGRPASSPPVLRRLVAGMLADYPEFLPLAATALVGLVAVVRTAAR